MKHAVSGFNAKFEGGGAILYTGTFVRRVVLYTGGFDTKIWGGVFLYTGVST